MIKHPLHKKSTQSGFVLIAILTTVSFITVAAIAVASLASNNLRIATSDVHRLGSQLAADAGIDASVQALNDDLDWNGSNGEKTIATYENYRTTYEASIEDGEHANTKDIVVTGKTYSPVSATDPISERSYTVTVRAVTSGNYSVVSGVGGLSMRNSSKVIGGNVHINGNLEMSNSAQIGLTTSPVNVSVANHNCPLSGGSSYPSLCPTNSSSPISISNNAWIYGEVKANNSHRIDGSTKSNMSNTGLVSGTVNANPLPSHDRQQQINQVAHTMSSNQASCTSNGGTVNWPANVKINGNVSVEKKCTVIAAGNAWITGNLDMRQSGTIKLANGVHTAPVIMVDGSSGLSMRNSAEFASNTSNRGFRVITYYSRASCSPNCAEVTGHDLFRSSDVTTISISNTSSGPNTEFYARWSTVELGNSGGIGALIGQKITMTNSAAVTFGTETSGGGQINGWVIESYKRNYQI